MSGLVHIDELHAQLGCMSAFPVQVGGLPVNARRSSTFASTRVAPEDSLGDMHRPAPNSTEKWTMDAGRMTKAFYDKADREMPVEQAV
ncbi:hypothetical protein ISP15_14775 [Dyella jejuensis]|uniref:Uncharacterized protein n=1 Tax=Dyella jejuensis TaxID=1432009 RepID=A0ABW8JKU9_9GAMM